ncbi:uncharacterized protein LOC117171392 isoform X1 [Belonocnema kinseyi]|uniref:uncharacterized protein LOC117171392 isoform X1 n=1 Tax=Belonocnema kinseyi TaxID=2817044 RepID=UPI00143D1857|nr:uncharacterized protein LOC117171392 isoform X1 [Belonocnema kinseyi]
MGRYKRSGAKYLSVKPLSRRKISKAYIKRKKLEIEKVKREESEEHQRNPTVLGELSRENGEYKQDVTFNINVKAVKTEPMEVPNCHSQNLMTDFETTNIRIDKKVFWESEEILGV